MSVVFENPSDLAGYLFRITDNGGATADRYTVAFSDGSYLTMSDAPTHPQGVSMWGDGLDPDVLEKRVSAGEEVDLALGDLPEHIVRHLIFRCNEGMADFLACVEEKQPDAVSPNREAAKVNEGTFSSAGDGIYWTNDGHGHGYRIRLDGPAEEDRGPYLAAREAVLASLPDVWGLAGPEYHTTVDDILRTTPSADVAQMVKDLEARASTVNDFHYGEKDSMSPTPFLLSELKGDQYG